MTDVLRSPRLDRERRTMRAMVRLFCAARHQSDGGTCAGCLELAGYADARIDHCPYGPGKPTCVNCPIHCYRPSMRERMKEVMRVSGPRMIWRHPILALRHVLDGKRPSPPLPNRRAAAAAQLRGA